MGSSIVLLRKRQLVALFKLYSFMCVYLFVFVLMFLFYGGMGESVILGCGVSCSYSDTH